jgi:hypothetical protein
MSNSQQRVYFAIHGQEVKIGVAANPPSRIKKMRTDRPDIRLLFDIPGGRELERQLHQRFRRFRIAGEWFHCAYEIQGFVNVERSKQGLEMLAPQRLEIPTPVPQSYKHGRADTRAALADRWYVHPETVKRDEKKGLLTPHYFGSRVRYRMSEVLALEHSTSRGAPQQAEIPGRFRRRIVHS